jgi:hypothetical protein
MVHSKTVKVATDACRCSGRFWVLLSRLDPSTDMAEDRAWEARLAVA